MVLRIAQILLVLLAISGHSALADTNYSKTVELPPLRISFAELQAILDKGASLLTVANGSTPLWREEIELRKGELRVKITGHRLDPDGAKIPKDIDSFEYTALTRDPASISRLALSFADYRRSLSVEGQSPEQVDAVFSALREDFSKLSTSVGGSGLKVFLGFPLIWLLLMVLLCLGGAWFQTRRRFLLMPASICAGLLAAVLLLPINDLLAGFSAVRGDASFIVRYGPEISFWGLVVGAVAIPISLIPLFYGRTPKTEKPAPNNVLKGTRRKRRAS
jgi:hypothetical protein